MFVNNCTPTYINRIVLVKILIILLYLKSNYLISISPWEGFLACKKFIVNLRSSNILTI